MKIQTVKLYHVSLPVKSVFKTAKTALSLRETLIIEVKDTAGQSGFGECVSFTEPFYTSETLERSKKILMQQYLPILLEKEISYPFDIHKWTDRKTPMAAAGVENALLDLYARKHGKNIISLVFEEKLKHYAEMGVVFGDIPHEELIQNIRRYQAAGCRRFKIKIKPEDGFEKMEKVKNEFPDLFFLVDANRSFQLSQMNDVAKYDKLDLLCIEEPFIFEHIEECQDIQKYIRTPICLDESIGTIEELEKAFQLNMVQMLNVKIGKLGGLYYTKQMIDFCREKGIRYWIGSMMESGISKILHIQLAGLRDVSLPGDLSDSARYFKRDLITPDISFKNGKMEIPKEPGLGVEIDEETLAAYAIESWIRSVEDYEFN